MGSHRSYPFVNYLELSPQHRSETLALWAAGFDTDRIASMLSLPESVIANNLPKLLEQRRQDMAWDGAA